MVHYAGKERKKLGTIQAVTHDSYRGWVVKHYPNFQTIEEKAMKKKRNIRDIFESNYVTQSKVENPKPITPIDSHIKANNNIIVDDANFYGVEKLFCNGLARQLTACPVISFDVPGLTRRRSGRFITIDASYNANVKTPLDQVINGEWLVVHTRHLFTLGGQTNSYKNELACVKTASSQQLQANTIQQGAS